MVLLKHRGTALLFDGFERVVTVGQQFLLLLVIRDGHPLLGQGGGVDLVPFVDQVGDELPSPSKVGEVVVHRWVWWWLARYSRRMCMGRADEIRAVIHRGRWGKEVLPSLMA